MGIALTQPRMDANDSLYKCDVGLLSHSLVTKHSVMSKSAWRLLDREYQIVMKYSLGILKKKGSVFHGVAGSVCGLGPRCWLDTDYHRRSLIFF